MANVNSIKATLESCFSAEWSQETARETKLVRRQGKIDIVAFFWILVLGFGTVVNRGIAELRRAYECKTDTQLLPSSFYERFTPQLGRFLKRAVAHVCQTMSEPALKLKGKLGAFVDLVVADASVVTPSYNQSLAKAS